MIWRNIMTFSDFLKNKEAQNEKINKLQKMQSSDFEMEYSQNTKKHLDEFERLNKTTKSIFDLGSYDVLIILEDGTNLTSWDDVKNKEDIVYVSEDLSKETLLYKKYANLGSLRLIIVQNVSNEIKSTNSMFSGCNRLVDVIGYETWDTSNLNSLENMFGECSALVACEGLKYLDVSNVRDMTALFIGCNSLSNLDSLKDWDVSKVTKMWSTFSNCKSLEDISALKDWDVSNVTDICSMFSGCDVLKELRGLESWDVSSVDDFSSLFWGCPSLGDVSALRNWDTSSASRFDRMFWDCENLEDISPLVGWNVSNVEDMVYMFVNCKSLKDLKALSNWNVSKVKIMRSMFNCCSALETLDGLENWNLESIITVERMFDGCTSLRNVSALKSWNIPNSIISGGIFNDCPDVKENPLKKEIKDKNKPLNYVDLNFKFLDIYGVGWCLVKLGDIYSRASYITDVPYDCLASIINAIKNDEDFHVDFNGEGWTFEVCADNEQCYFNYHGGEKHAFDTMNKYDLAIVIYRNIIDDLSSWQNWSNEDLEPSLKELEQLIDEWLN